MIFCQFPGATSRVLRARSTRGLGRCRLPISISWMGLTPAGQGARAALEGWTARDGRLPVNRSGGLKSKGHPIGATGVSMHVITAMQLTGEAGAMQLPKADLGAVFNMGGAAVANYV